MDLLSFAGKWKDLPADRTGEEVRIPAPPEQVVMGARDPFPAAPPRPGVACAPRGRRGLKPLSLPAAPEAAWPCSPALSPAIHPRQSRGHNGVCATRSGPRGSVPNGVGVCTDALSLQRPLGIQMPPSPQFALCLPSKLWGCFTSMCHLHWVTLVFLVSEECSTCANRSPTPCRNSVPNLA